MPDNQVSNTSIERDPREVDGFCHLEYIDIFQKSSSHFGGFWSRTIAPKDPSNFVPQSFYQNNPSFPEKSEELRIVTQNSGGLLPVVNTNLGAPLCTFILGGITPGQVHPKTDYIKGPSELPPIKYKYKTAWSETIEVSKTINPNDISTSPTIPINKNNQAL